MNESVIRIPIPYEIKRKIELCNKALQTKCENCTKKSTCKEHLLAHNLKYLEEKYNEQS